MSALGSKYCQRYASSLGIGWGFPAPLFGGGTVGPVSGCRESRGGNQLLPGPQNFFAPGTSPGAKFVP